MNNLGTIDACFSGYGVKGRGGGWGGDNTAQIYPVYLHV